MTMSLQCHVLTKIESIQALANTSQRPCASRLHVSAQRSCITIESHLFIYKNRHPTEPSCMYDPVEGLRLAPNTDPSEKIKDLEDQIGV
jgi:hypothetical protein